MNTIHLEDKIDVILPRILIIDDNPSNIQLAATLLKRNNYEVVTAMSGHEGLQKALESSPDLILLDIMMPEMDGYEVCTILQEREETNNIPIIFLTALKQTESLSKGFELGGVDYITKPFKKEELFARVKTHIELKRSKDTILAQNKKLHKLNDEKNSLMHITAHDLKNPLQGISGLVEILQFSRDEIDDDEYNSVCENIQATTSHALHIIYDLVDSYALEHGKYKFKYENISINEILDEVVEDFENIAKVKNISININKENDANINVDRSKFKRILENLISNAIKFSHNDTKVSIIQKNINGSTLISVVDEGPGFSEEDKSKLFTKYSQLSAKPTGGESSTGLGLSIVKSLVENMGGEITLNSEKNKGAEFILKFNIV